MFKKLEALKGKGYKEKEVDTKLTDGMKIIISTLTSDEEMNSHIYAQDYNKMGYIYTLKREILAHAIKEVDGVNLRNIKFVEVKEEGEIVKVQKNVYFRDLFKTWNHEIINHLFMEYSLLYNLNSSEMEKAMEFIVKQANKATEDIAPGDVESMNG